MTYKKVFLTTIAAVYLSCFVFTNGYAQANKNTCEGKQDSILHKFVYTKVDEAPEPEGGLSKMIGVLFKSIRLPQDSSFYGGRVIVAFVIEPDGLIVGKRIIMDSSSNHFIGKQILDIVSKAKWKPAKCKGKAVPYLYALPVIIEASDE